MKTFMCLTMLAAALVAVAPVQAAGPGEGPGPEAQVERPELTPELQAKLDAVIASRQTLLDELKALLQENADATPEERQALVAEWREDNADELAAVRESMQAVRADIREWWLANRPAGPKDGKNGEDPGLFGAVEGEAYMTKLKEQRQTREQAMKALKQELDNAATEEQRKQIMLAHREERMTQVQEARQENKVRREQTDRDASVALLRDRLQDSAETLRTQLRTRDREEAAIRLAPPDQATIRDAIRIQDRDRVNP